ncbi:MAG: CopD family protein [Tateyamaria sp.]|uniref:copper resistance D family protein n=1 Tax=Alphaproteobacteria TaxID=28211 RepID=UPI0032638C2A
MAKAAGYGVALLAMGGPLFSAVLPNAEPSVHRLARQIATTAAIVAIAILAIRFGIRAGRISGMGLPGAVDPTMLGIDWNSPLGTSAIWQTVGMMLVLGMRIRGATGVFLGLAGAVLIAVSLTFVGHSLGSPRWVLASFLVIHLLCAGFWVAALAPLYLAASQSEGALLLHRFGVIASGAVALLLAAGVGFVWQVSGSISTLFSTAYGTVLVAKLAAVSGLMMLAAFNKWRFVPALADRDSAAVEHLRASIRLEGLAVVLILILTATLTSVTTPPANL